MAYLRKLALAILVAAASSAAQAADMPLPAPAVVDYGGWYLRGDIGFSNQQVKRLESPAPGFSTSPVISKAFDSAGIYDLGIGYKFNNWLRADVTGEYRANANFNALQTYHCPSCTPTDSTDQYNFTKSEWLFLLNGYVDLGTWYSITPFVGAGIGFDRLSISNFTDINVPAGAIGYSGDTSKWNFAWALYAGFGYQLTPNCTFEVSYRFVSLGNAGTQDMLSPGGGNPTPNNPIYFKNIYSNDVRVGLRWMLADGFFPEPEPLVRKY